MRWPRRCRRRGKVPARQSPVLDAVTERIDAMLREDLDAPRKQRHTSRRIWQRLRDEDDAAVSYSYVCQYAGRRRAEIEAGHRAAAVSGDRYLGPIRPSDLHGPF